MSLVSSLPVVMEKFRAYMAGQDPDLGFCAQVVTGRLPELTAFWPNHLRASVEWPGLHSAVQTGTGDPRAPSWHPWLQCVNAPETEC